MHIGRYRYAFIFFYAFVQYSQIALFINYLIAIFINNQHKNRQTNEQINKQT